MLGLSENGVDHNTYEHEQTTDSWNLNPLHFKNIAILVMVAIFLWRGDFKLKNTREILKGRSRLNPLKTVVC
jgi:hypothetical protein